MPWRKTENHCVPRHHSPSVASLTYIWKRKGIPLWPSVGGLSGSSWKFVSMLDLSLAHFMTIFVTFAPCSRGQGAGGVTSQGSSTGSASCSPTARSPQFLSSRSMALPSTGKSDAQLTSNNHDNDNDDDMEIRSLCVLPFRVTAG